MKLQLILAGSYEACKNTRKIWTDACNQHQLMLEVTDLDNETGQALEQSLKIKSFPALVIDNEVKAVGHPNKDAAFQLIEKLCEK